MDVARKILVADDERNVARLIQKNLENAGYEAVCAYDGRETLQKLDSEKPSLIILDIDMPYADGFEILEIMRASPDTKDLPVILLTAKTAQTDIARGWHVGADCYITKPFDPAELLG